MATGNEGRCIDYWIILCMTIIIVRSILYSSCLKVEVVYQQVLDCMVTLGVVGRRIEWAWFNNCTYQLNIYCIICLNL